VNKELIEEILTHAGMKWEDVADGMVEDDFSSVLVALWNVKAFKERQYGNYVDDQMQGHWKVALIDHFINIRRKFNRAQKAVTDAQNESLPPFTELVDTYADMAVYSILGIILINAMRKKHGNN
jgi:hypothetical protein